MDVLFEKRLCLGDCESEHFHLLSHSLLELRFILFEGESSLWLVSVVSHPIAASSTCSVIVSISHTVISSSFHFNVVLSFFSIKAAIQFVTSIGLNGRRLLLEESDCEPLLGSLSLQGLDDHVEF